MMQAIEVEYRVEVVIGDFDKLLLLFNKRYTSVSHTKRLSYMGFLRGTKDLDFRARVTNGKSEIVLKVGALDASDRTEISIDISKSKLIDYAKLFSHVVDESYISERETYNFNSDENIFISLVKAQKVAYIEFELLSSEENFVTNKKLVSNFIEGLGLQVLDKHGFDNLNQKLSENDDWLFDGSNQHILKLKSLLENY